MRLIPWQLRHFRAWLDMRRVYRELYRARRNGRAVLSVSAGIVLR
uniref:Uncharacterized protein n=1 Tax=uncultured prokaryote TaxID=198431 RepID=A0A0H5QLC1_9ZZZZ|nr:hypothetical protein [uncultured prokaryote]